MRDLARRTGGAVAVIGLIALGTRLWAINEVLAAVLVGSVAVCAVGGGTATSSRCHRPGWRRAWFLLWLAIVARASGTVLEVISNELSDDFPSHVHVLQGVGAVLALAGVDRLMRHRHPGRASEVLFESAIVSTLLGLTLWLVVVEPRSGSSVPEWELLFALAMAGAGAAALWMVVRLVGLTDEHPVAYRYLAVGLLCLLTVDSVIAGGLLEGGDFGDRYRSALVLWGYVLWGLAALHPSMRSSFEPVPQRSTELRPARVAFVLGAALVGPALVMLQAVRGVQISVQSELVASTLVPLLVTIEMVRQVRERATREYLAQHDALTGLPNRVLFYDRLQTALAQSRRADRRVGVMFLDLDRFKEVNDSLGHDVGNQLLQGVARRLRRCLREQDAIARFGGDEFTILLTDLDGPDACAAVAEKVLRAFREPFSVNGRDLFAATSIGVAVFPDDGTDADTLMKNADTAMYRAKAKGRSGYEFYTKEMSVRAEVRHSLEGSLHRAIQRGELSLHYQPKVRRTDRSLTGVEALVRWRHPRLGSIPPSAFVPLAEESGLILPLGDWVLQEACQQAATWSTSRSQPIAVAVNVSARQFMHEPLERTVARVLDETGLDPALLELELTESVFLRDIDAVNVTMQQLHEMGVRCSIDDFGTGFSALNYLGRMPIDTVKIDGSFVSEIRADQPAPLLVAMISMAKSLDLGVVAEGVETEEQAEFLLRHGCEQMQGYLFSRPLPPLELEQLPMLQDAAWRPAAPAMTGGTALAVAASAGLDPKTVIDLLEAACRDGDPLHADPDLVRAVLVALDDPQLAVAQWTSRSLPVRLAAGTFAGLVPLSGGLLAADMLPASAQQLATVAFSNLGMEMPHLGDHEGSPTTPDLIASPPVDSPPGHSTPTTVLGSTARRSLLPEVASAPTLAIEDVDPPRDHGSDRRSVRPERTVPAPDSTVGPPVDREPPGAPHPEPHAPAPDHPVPTPPHVDRTPPPPPPGPPDPGVQTPPEDQPTPPERDRTPPDRGQKPPELEQSPPDHEDSQPERDRTPPDRDQSPPDHDHTPPDPDRTPPNRDQSPPDSDQSPPDRDDTPPDGDDQSPPDHDQTPPGHDQTPPDRDDTPPGQGESPPDPDRTPPDRGRTPPAQEEAPPGQDDTTRDDDQTPPGQGQTPPVDEHTPSDEAPTRTDQGQTQADPGEAPTAPEHEPPVHDDTPQERTRPGNDTPASQEQDPADRDEHAPGDGQTATTHEKTPSAPPGPG